MSFLIKITVLARVNDTSGKVCSRSLGLVSSRIKFDKIVIVLLPRAKNRQEKPAVISTLFATLKRWSSFHHSASREIRRRGKNTVHRDARNIAYTHAGMYGLSCEKKKRTTRPLRRDRSTIMHNVTRRVVNITVNGNGSVILRAETHGQNHRCRLTSRYFSALHFSRRTKNPSLGHSRERYVA